MINKDLKSKIIKLCGKEYFYSLYLINESRTILDTIFILSSYILNLLLLIFLYKLSPAISYIFLPFSIFFNAVIFNWINVQCHEASHKLLFKNKKVNDNYFNFILGYFSFHDVETYKTTHKFHHMYLHEEKDPDRDYYEVKSNFKSFFILFFKDIIGMTAIKRFFQINKSQLNKKNNWIIFYKILYQFIILNLLIIFTDMQTGFLFFFFLQIYSLICILPIIIRIRTIVQHYRPTNENKMWTSRSTRATIFERVIFGARMDYHFEHHLFPAIPYYNLNKLNDLLLKHDFFKSKENDRFITTNYFGFAKQIKI